MYEAMRQRAPFSTRATGATATLLIGAAAAYVLLTGFGAVIVKAVQRPMVMATIPAKPVPPDRTTPPPATPDETLFRLPAPPPPQTIPDYKFTIDDPTGPDEPGQLIKPGFHIGPPPARVPVLTAPKMKPADPPPYPAVAIRGSMQGTSDLSLCIDAKGRVTSASLAKSSGHDVLDEAALKWARNARFSPGLSDGAPKAVCGHPVAYVWTLETLRR